MIDAKMAFRHKLSQVAKAEGISEVPPDGPAGDVKANDRWQPDEG
jgi:hypothetical protein